MAEKREYNRLISGSYCDIYCAMADHIKIKDIGIGGICLETSRHLKINSIYSMNFVTNEIGKKTLKAKLFGLH